MIIKISGSSDEIAGLFKKLTLGNAVSQVAFDHDIDFDFYNDTDDTADLDVDLNSLGVDLNDIPHFDTEYYPNLEHTKLEHPKGSMQEDRPDFNGEQESQKLLRSTKYVDLVKGKVAWNRFISSWLVNLDEPPVYVYDSMGRTQLDPSTGEPVVHSGKPQPNRGRLVQELGSGPDVVHVLKYVASVGGIIHAVAVSVKGTTFDIFDTISDQDRITIRNVAMSIAQTASILNPDLAALYEHRDPWGQRA